MPRRPVPRRPTPASCGDVPATWARGPPAGPADRPTSKRFSAFFDGTVQCLCALRKAAYNRDSLKGLNCGAEWPPGVEMHVQMHFPEQLRRGTIPSGAQAVIVPSAKFSAGVIRSPAQPRPDEHAKAQFLTRCRSGPLHAARGSEANKQNRRIKAPGARRTPSPRLSFTAIIRQPQFVNLTPLLTEPRAVWHEVPA